MASEDAVHAPEVADTPAPAPAQGAETVAPPADNYQQDAGHHRDNYSQGGQQQPSRSQESSDDRLPMFVGGLNNPCDEAAFEALVNEFGPTTSVAVRTCVLICLEIVNSGALHVSQTCGPPGHGFCGVR